MTARTALVLAALAVSLAHFLSRAWLSDEGGALGTTVGGLVIFGSAALVWLHAPRWRPAVAVLGFPLLASAFDGPIADLLAGDASAADYTGLPLLAAGNVLLAAGLWELVGTQDASHPARA
jgi:hypothetical protein